MNKQEILKRLIPIIQEELTRDKDEDEKIIMETKIQDLIAHEVVWIAQILFKAEKEFGGKYDHKIFFPVPKLQFSEYAKNGIILPDELAKLDNLHELIDFAGLPENPTIKQVEDLFTVEYLVEIILSDPKSR